VLGLPMLIFGLGSVLSKFVPATSLSTFVYTSNYSLNLYQVINNSYDILLILLNGMSPFLKLVGLIALFMFIFRSQRSTLFRRELVYWLLFSIFSIGILTPWKFVLDRYYLIGILGLTIVVAYILNMVWIWINNSFYQPIVSELILLLLLSNLFFRGFPINLARTINYQHWFAIFTTFEKDQVLAISKYNSNGLAINAKEDLTNWEFLYEIPIHLRMIRGINSNIELVDGTDLRGEYVFTRSSSDPVYKAEDLSKNGYSVVESHFYNVDQIDPLAFRNNFKLRPLQSLQSPPLQTDGLSYYWEIRQKNIW
jgi:hypothetical protein